MFCQRLVPFYYQICVGAQAHGAGPGTWAPRYGVADLEAVLRQRLSYIDCLRQRLPYIILYTVCLRQRLPYIESYTEVDIVL